MKWTYETGGEQKGPVDQEQLQAMLSDGSLAPDNKVWHKGLSAWTPAGEVPELSVRPDEDDEERQGESSAVDDAMAALAAAAAPTSQSSSYGDDKSQSSSQEDVDHAAPDSGRHDGGGGAPANPLAELAGGLSNLTGGGGSGLLGGLDALTGGASALRDKAIPKTAAEVKHDFIETSPKAKGSNAMLVKAANGGAHHGLEDEPHPRV
jgi:hypothetical protein